MASLALEDSAGRLESVRARSMIIVPVIGTGMGDQSGAGVASTKPFPL